MSRCRMPVAAKMLHGYMADSRRDWGLVSGEPAPSLEGALQVTRHAVPYRKASLVKLRHLRVADRQNH